MVDEVDVLLPVAKHKRFIQVESTTLSVLAKHAQCNQKKFTITLQYTKENVKDEVDFFTADKRFLQMILSF